jgi:hypothetical protein
MEINLSKSCLLPNNILEDVIRQLGNIFAIRVQNLDEGLNFLGFILKQNNYNFKNWLWIYKKIEAISLGK